MDFNAAWPVLVIVIGYLALLVLGSTFRSGIKDVLKSDYNVLFFSILVGLALVSTSELVVSLSEILVPPVHGFLSYAASYIVENLPTIRYFLPYENEQYDNTHFVSVLLISVVLVVTLRPFFNTRKKRVRIIRKHAERRGEHIACFLQDALKRENFVQLSLLNGRVYIGQIVNTPITDIEEKDADVSLRVVLSGYRHPDTRDITSLKWQLNQKYEIIYQVHIPLGQVESAGTVSLEDVSPVIRSDVAPSGTLD